MHVGGASVRGEQAGGHRQRRRLTSTVGANDPIEGSGGDIEGQVSDGDEVTIDLDEASNRQGDVVSGGGDGCRRG